MSLISLIVLTILLGYFGLVVTGAFYYIIRYRGLKKGIEKAREKELKVTGKKEEPIVM